MAKCSNCIHVAISLASGGMQCHWGPPQIFQSNVVVDPMNETVEWKHESAFPPVKPDWSCGQYSALSESFKVPSV